MVDAKETKEKDLREERLHLMRVCIERQREQLQEMSEKLRRRMERSQRKERVIINFTYLAIFQLASLTLDLLRLKN